MSRIDKNISLYIHIPFCKSKCYYCDFISYPNMESYHKKYIVALINEIRQVGKRLNEYTIKSVFIGGGTPTILSESLLYELITNLNYNFKFSKDIEFTIESNPGTLDKSKIKLLKNLGVNRISLGLQSCNNALLKSLGRIHTYEQFKENYYELRQAGFNNINIDLIFGLPKQTFKDWKETLSKVVSLQPEHLSCYSLIIEENTKFYDMYKNHKLSLPTEELERKMYHYTIDFLKQAGYYQYEISNFSKSSLECKHNIVYWECKQYIGLGAAAHSYFGYKRYHNPISVNDYIKKSDNINYLCEEIESINPKMQMEEFMYMGLRMINGISFDEFYNRFHKDIFSVYGEVIKELINNHLLQQKDNKIFLTKRGLDLANQVYIRFLIDY